VIVVGAIDTNDGGKQEKDKLEEIKTSIKISGRNHRFFTDFY
jgi:hypothetical protein